MEIRKLQLNRINGAKQNISIGSGCVIIQNGKVLLVRASDKENFEFPGGHIHDNESLQAAALRETLEETECEVEIKGEPYLFLQEEADLQILLFHYLADIKKGVPKLGDNIQEILWADIHDLPKNCYPNIQITVEYFSKETL
jgi:ADP-ribose pyrophosphatase YjhB (NUDIX family)